jgi:hypothetical protein
MEKDGDIFTTVHMMMIIANVLYSIKYEVTFNEQQTNYNSQVKKSSHNNISLSPHMLPRYTETIKAIQNIGSSFISIKMSRGRHKKYANMNSVPKTLPNIQT